MTTTVEFYYDHGVKAREAEGRETPGPGCALVKITHSQPREEILALVLLDPLGFYRHVSQNSKKVA